jgi:CRP/FNR family cyclic AMP-dependent transcriptional regulator
MECGKPRNNRMRCAIAFPCGAHWIDMAGYVASLLVFATFYMKTMIPLRIIAVLSNVAFIVYASSDGLHEDPVFFGCGGLA